MTDRYTVSPCHGSAVDHYITLGFFACRKCGATFDRETQKPVTVDWGDEVKGVKVTK